MAAAHRSWSRSSVDSDVGSRDQGCETDDEEEVERLSDEIAKLACDEPMAADHACRLPWFLITSGLDDVDAAT